MGGAVIEGLLDEVLKQNIHLRIIVILLLGWMLLIGLAMITPLFINIVYRTFLGNGRLYFIDRIIEAKAMSGVTMMLWCTLEWLVHLTNVVSLYYFRWEIL